MLDFEEQELKNFLECNNLTDATKDYIQKRLDWIEEAKQLAKNLLADEQEKKVHTTTTFHCQDHEIWD